MRGASYAGRARTLYAVTAAGAIVGTRTTARVYSHAVVVASRKDGSPVALSWHLGLANATKRAATERADGYHVVLELAQVVEAPAGREALERVLEAVRRGDVETPPERGPAFPDPNLDESRGRGLTALLVLVACLGLTGCGRAPAAPPAGPDAQVVLWETQARQLEAEAARVQQTDLDRSLKLRREAAALLEAAAGARQGSR